MKKVAVVFGGSGGIGIEICKALLKLEYMVIGTYCNGYKRFAEIQNHLNFEAIQCDTTINSEVINRITYILEKYKEIDVLVNTVGISEESFFVDKDVESWEKVMKTNLFSVFYTCHAVVPHMLDRQYGVIINLSSILGEFGIPGMSDYCAAKSGILGFSKSLAAELARFGIRVNCVSPGMMDTSMTDQAQKQIGKQVKRLIPSKRFGKPDEIANLICYLISDSASYITGENISIGGGLGRTLPVS